MKPIKFPESNVTFAKDQPQYKQLPAFKNNSPQGEVVTCWHLSFRERLRILFKGKLWVCMLSFNKPLSPIALSTKKEYFLKAEEKTEI